MIISPRFLRGAKTALLAPITISTSPLTIRRYSSYFSPSDKALCNNASLPAKRSSNLLINWGVKDISGTKTILFKPLAKYLLIKSIYTSVLPLPVTPYNKETVLSVAKILVTAFFVPLLILFLFWPLGHMLNDKSLLL